MTWSDRRIIELFGIEHPIVQAPMAGAMDAELVIAAARGGALGSLPCAMLSASQVREQVALVRASVNAPINLNFFCHEPTAEDHAKSAAWRQRLAPYYVELGLDPNVDLPGVARNPFDASMAEVIEELAPIVVSFHFGLPSDALLKRVRAAKCLIIASATTVKEAKWLEARGVDAVIAQGAEAGGHRGIFLDDAIASQPGTFALVPQVADAVRVPVIAAGGIADGRTIAAAFALGASGVQIGTAYLRCPEAKISALFRAALANAKDDSTMITNVMTGRPARGIANRVMRELGPITNAPAFPHAASALAPLRKAAEARSSPDFTQLWSGQSVALTREMPATELTRSLAAEALARLTQI